MDPAAQGRYNANKLATLGLILLVLILGLHWLLQRRYALLVPLGFLYVWLYNAFPLLLVVAGTYVIAGPELG